MEEEEVGRVSNFVRRRHQGIKKRPSGAAVEGPLTLGEFAGNFSEVFSS
jgi:hypothetical protein